MHQNTTETHDIDDIVAWGMEYEYDAQQGEPCNHVFHYYLHLFKSH